MSRKEPTYTAEIDADRAAALSATSKRKLIRFILAMEADLAEFRRVLDGLNLPPGAPDIGPGSYCSPPQLRRVLEALAESNKAA